MPILLRILLMENPQFFFKSTIQIICKSTDLSSRMANVTKNTYRPKSWNPLQGAVDRYLNEREREITNGISSLRKLSKNEIQQPNNYKKVFEYVWEKKLCTTLDTSMDRWTSWKLHLHWQNTRKKFWIYLQETENDQSVANYLVVEDTKRERKPTVNPQKIMLSRSKAISTKQVN